MMLLPIQNDDTLFTIEEFMEEVDKGGLIDYDGCGEWATETEKLASSVVLPSRGLRNKPKWATHIVWYNR